MKQSQRGAVLVISMLIMLVMTLVAVSSLQSGVVGSKMVANQRNSTLAFEAANSALRQGENWLEALVESPETCNATSCDIWTQDTMPNVLNSDASWWANAGTAQTETVDNVDSQPAYVIEEYSFIPDDLSTDGWASGAGMHYYEVTGRGVGGSTDADTLVQSIYATRYN